MKNFRFAFLLAVLAAMGCSTAWVKAEPEPVTMIQLIAAPEKYEGKHVRVIGYLHLEFEGNVLYLHKEDYDHSILGNGIWVDLGRDQQKLSDNYVLLEGIFSAKNRGHGGMWSGRLTDINRSMVWSSRSEPRGLPRPTPLKPKN